MSVTFDQAIERVVDQRRQREDITIPLKAFSLGLNAKSQIVGTIDGTDYLPTGHCMKQMASIMGVSHAVLRQYTSPVMNLRMKKGVQYETIRYRRDQTDLELLVALFKNGIRDGRVDPDKKFKFRTYNDGTLRAMLTERYAIIDNVWYINHLRGVFKTLGGDEPKFTHWGGDADSIYGNLVLPGVTQNGGDSQYNGMLSIGNCEIGKHRLSITPSVWRMICTNGMMGWAKGQRWSKVHRGEINLNDLADDITAKIGDTIPKLTEGIAALLEAKKQVLTARPSEVIAQIAETFNLTTGEHGEALQTIREYGKHETSFNSLFGIINAITRTAQTCSPAEQFRLEAIGGELLQLGQTGWARINTLASGMKEEKRNKIFGRVSA